MYKKDYIGVDNKARKIKNIYVGVNNKARKVKRAYIGVNNIAHLIYDDTGKLITWKKYDCKTTQVDHYHYKEDNLKVGQTSNNYSVPFTTFGSFLFSDTGGYILFQPYTSITENNISESISGDYCLTKSSDTEIWNIYSVNIENKTVNLTCTNSATKEYQGTTTTYTKGSYISDITAYEGEQPEAGVIIEGSVSDSYIVIKASDNTPYYYERSTI